ncbi:uncharacterized protein EV420DRAFT_1752480 [Desarmillaria tabescens]|uniref:F-box domain-containing protein n=1 Tax=Armillaria tabescens TaxID=1929756 RepID=A0AA39JJE0_ARMTA|nr:uncharacterized protein EV420DRAFT_1752480 [Desarmillaria tabescens]KAK0441523.1 hypothetical protein EV420DRAFT_1752480 [Desarmillaria tabescens]
MQTHPASRTNARLFRVHRSLVPIPHKEMAQNDCLQNTASRVINRQKSTVRLASNTTTTTIISMTRRLRVGMLVRLLSMPPEMWLEIMGHLSPKDVLNLARTSKDLRSVFMHPSSTTMWKTARKTVDCLPPMSGFSEPRWANLMFVNKCNVRRVFFYWSSDILAHLCSSSSSVVKVRCAMLIFFFLLVYARSAWASTSFLTLRQVLIQVGSTLIKKLLPKRREKEFDVVKAKYLSLPKDKVDTYRQEKREYVKQVLNFVYIGNTWRQKMVKQREEELKELKENRAAAITKKLEALGYGEAFESLDFKLKFPEHPLVKQASALTEKEAVKAVEDERVSKALVTKTRIALATDILESRTAQVPSITDFLAFGPLKDILDLPLRITVGARHLRPVVDDFRKHWAERTQDELLRVLGDTRSKRQKRDYLACNVVYLSESKRRRVWTAEYLSRHESLMAFMPTFIRAIGLDPESATVEEIASLKQNHLCLICPGAHPFDGRSKTYLANYPVVRSSIWVGISQEEVASFPTQRYLR